MGVDVDGGELRDRQFGGVCFLSLQVVSGFECLKYQPDGLLSKGFGGEPCILGPQMLDSPKDLLPV